MWDVAITVGVWQDLGPWPATELQGCLPYGIVIRNHWSDTHPKFWVVKHPADSSCPIGVTSVRLIHGEGAV